MIDNHTMLTFKLVLGPTKGSLETSSTELMCVGYANKNQQQLSIPNERPTFDTL